MSYDFFVDHMLQAHQLGKRKQDYQMDGRHTEGVWGPGKRKRVLQPPGFPEKRVLQPPGMRGGTVWWTPRPTGTFMMAHYDLYDL